jgi:hypothetical protein
MIKIEVYLEASTPVEELVDLIWTKTEEIGDASVLQVYATTEPGDPQHPAAAVKE